MNEEITECPMPVPQPCAKPVLAIVHGIQLKSLKHERDLKKSLTYRNQNNFFTNTHSVDDAIFNSPTAAKKRKRPSIISQVKKSNSPEKIPHKEINLIRRSSHSINTNQLSRSIYCRPSYKGH